MTTLRVDFCDNPSIILEYDDKLSLIKDQDKILICNGFIIKNIDKVIQDIRHMLPGFYHDLNDPNQRQYVKYILTGMLWVYNKEIYSELRKILKREGVVSVNYH